MFVDKGIKKQKLQMQINLLKKKKLYSYPYETNKIALCPFRANYIALCPISQTNQGNVILLKLDLLQIKLNSEFHALFTRPISTEFSKIFIKTRSYGTIHTFKNYFVAMFSVFSNKCYPNKPLMGFMKFSIICGGKKEILRLQIKE